MNISSLTNIAISTEQSSIQNQIGVARLSKNLDAIEIAGEGIKKMMEASVTPELGQNIDVYV